MISDQAVTKRIVKSRERIADHGEVFTPEWLVDAMLNQVQAETERIDSRFLEPACGDGNFLVKILERKLAAVDAKYATSEFQRRNYALLALMCIYGIEFLEDNVLDCRENLLRVFVGHIALDASDGLIQAARNVLAINIVHGDAMKMARVDGDPIRFSEWGYVGKGKFQRRDFRLSTLALSSSFSAEDSLFSELGRHEVFAPERTYEPMTIADLAACEIRSEE